MTNSVSHRILEDKGQLHIDGQHRRLHRDGVTFMLFTRNGGHYVLEDNTNDQSDIAMATAQPAVFLTDESASQTREVASAFAAIRSGTTQD